MPGITTSTNLSYNPLIDRLKWFHVHCLTPMTCLGLINKKNLTRCRNPGKPLFCPLHSRQPLVWLFVSVFTVLAGTASILSYVGHSGVPVIDKKGPTPPETIFAPPVSSPSVLPSPRESPTPHVKTQGDANRNLRRESGRSAHLDRARVLYKQARYKEALDECDAELRANPRNKEALTLREHIKKTNQILNQ